MVKSLWVFGSTTEGDGSFAMSDGRALIIHFLHGDGLSTDAIVEVGRSLLVGRDLSCEVRLEGRRVSRRHLRLENRVDGLRVVTDVGSHNGTYVNGARVSERGALLNEGDIVSCGEWDGRVELRRLAQESQRRGVAMVPVVSLPAQGIATLSVAEHRHLDGTDSFLVPNVAALMTAVTEPMPPAAAAPSVRPVEPPRLPPRPITTPRPTTMVLPASLRVNNIDGADPGVARTWGWDEGVSPATDQVRAARVDDNPIVKRIAETSTRLDFRGLSELPPLQESATPAPGLRASSGTAIDGIALRLVFKVTEALASTASMDDFLAEMSTQLSMAARAKGIVVLLPGEDGQLAPRVVKTRRPEEKIQLSRTVIDYVIQNKSALTTEDAAADERFARGESVLRFDLKAVLCVPLMKQSPSGAGNDVIGVLYLTRDLPFTNTERDLVAALAHLIAMGLERTRLREEYADAERTRRSLERFHAPDVVRRLMMDSSQGVHRDGLFLEPLTATVLFCDLAGFTTYCEAHEPEQVGMLLNSYLATMTETVFAYGGTVDKFIGDAVMCIFGAPFMTDDDALRAVRCAAQMRTNFRQLVQSGACGEDARALDVHIGVNTGKVVAGTVGSPRRMEYTALGDTVNTAARLEGVARAGQIVVGSSTAALVCDRFPLIPAGARQLKGKGQQVEIFLVPDDA